jgi:glutamate-1-semialdehyde 2,1-aminomutase
MRLYRTPKSEQLARMGEQVIPAAQTSNWRGFQDHRPTYFTRGQGSHLFDADENEYIDFDLSHGPAILGHNHAGWRQAISRQLADMHSPEANELEISAAQKIVEHVASAELVRFTCTGTEATAGALRVARAYTGRNMYIRFHGHYHGGQDHMLGGITPDPDHPVPVPGEYPDDLFTRWTNTMGRSRLSLQEVYVIEWNDLPGLEKLLERYADDIAAVIMEPVMINHGGCVPEPGYLQGVRELCTRYGVLLIFDEVLTGFRIDLKGAQGFFGVTPDLTALGKAVGGGFPISCYAGKRQIMDVLARCEVVDGGTYFDNPLGMAALTTTIGELEKDSGAAYKHIRKLGTALKDGLDEIARRYEQPLLLQGFPGSWTILFTPKRKVVNQAGVRGSDFAKSGRFGQLMAERGVNVARRFLISTAHTEADIQEALERADDAMKQLQIEDRAGKK